MQSNSTASTFAGKPQKPRPDFPLFPHATKRWAKKIRGQMHYFGPWDDPAGAEQRYLDQKDALHSGRRPGVDVDGVTLKDLVNKFLNHKQDRVTSGRLAARTFAEYKQACDLLIEHVGKRTLIVDIGPDDFTRVYRKISNRWGLHRLAKIMQCIRSVFVFGNEDGMIEKHVKFGPSFEKPTKKEFRIKKASEPKKLFSRDELRDILAEASQPMRTMILLGINCGFGNSDCGTLPRHAVDLDAGWIDFPRPKTGIARRCPLWQETVKALREWLERRPEPKATEHADLVFITKQGDAWAKDTSDNPVIKEMSKLLKKLKINSHRNFYTLRHTHRTVGDEVRDQRASGYIMGHVDPSIAGVYVEHIADDRLLAITNHIHDWLFGKVKRARKPVMRKPRLRIAPGTNAKASASA